MIKTDPIIQWLLKGDPSIRWQVHRDLLDSPIEVIESEHRKIATKGWGKQLLDLQDEKGLWAKGLYTPKWTSTTYTMLLLWRMRLAPDNIQARKAAYILLEKGFYTDNGINYFGSLNYGEQCVTGMILTLCSYFQIDDPRVDRLADFLKVRQLTDGSWLLQQRYPGRTHFEMEEIGKPSRWNTLRALRVLKWYQTVNTGGYDEE